MCLRLVKYCWTSLGLLLEERSHGIDCLLREQSIFEITKTCVQITIRNAAPTKTCAYEIHFCGKEVSAKKDFPLFLWKCHFISIFVHILLVSTTLWSQKCSCFPWEGRNCIFSCPDLCLHKLVPHQFAINLFVSKLLSNLKTVPISWIFFIGPVRHASPASDSGTGSVNGKNMQIFLTHQIGAQFKLLRLF